MCQVLHSKENRRTVAETPSLRNVASSSSSVDRDWPGEITASASKLAAQLIRGKRLHLGESSHKLGIIQDESGRILVRPPISGVVPTLVEF